jgi:hypothetical protein
VLRAEDGEIKNLPSQNSKHFHRSLAEDSTHHAQFCAAGAYCPAPGQLQQRFCRFVQRA